VSLEKTHAVGKTTTIRLILGLGLPAADAATVTASTGLDPGPAALLAF
jgi:hypothetical protein